MGGGGGKFSFNKLKSAFIPNKVDTVKLQTNLKQKKNGRAYISFKEHHRNVILCNSMSCNTISYKQVLHNSFTINYIVCETCYVDPRSSSE